MEWVDVRLGEACTKIGSGSTPRGGGSVYLDEGPIAFIRSQNVYNEGFSIDGLVYLDEKLAQGLANVRVEELDVLLNITGDSVARACQVITEVLPARVNQHVAIIRTNQEVLWPTYLRYFLVSPAMQAQMLGLAAVGATRNALTKGTIESFSIKCPKKVDDQKAIADILSSLDIRIDINRRINQTLEAMAQAIFKSWFVDFDPVKAKIAAIQEGRDPLRAAMSAISGKIGAELDALPREHYDQLAATAALFPDEMEESELGEIPKGWSAKKFGDFIDRISVGKKFDQKTAFAEGAVPILDQGKSGIIGFHNETPGVCASLEKPVVVFANHTCYMRLITFDFSAIQNVLPFVGKGVDTVWAYYATKDIVKFSEYKGHWPDFVLADAVVPQSVLTVHFRKILHPLISQMRILELESEKLATLRDTLLPKLLSGELFVDDTIEETAV